MRLRRSIIAAVLAPTMALATVTPAVAETTTQGSSTTTEGSSTKESDEWWENLNPFAKVAIGIAAATGISVAFGVLRTIFYNIFHV
ncbi:hypothetical protein ACN4EB_01445 [Corynebacterium macclintockiae]|uniref:Secreted protein n=1 Tax=Corynebacterium macclintockiae TaxID=2913501 RepID=A0A9X3RQZ2_9CORY|nr:MULTISPECIES: hypothetical protein [Corynebacterium]MCZ9304536.1 hypothetical protein [Corynebacterium macclintockiae]MDK8890320.1 hypothetical protein [Corynebacterium macclintockiae]OFM59543.1 hypothetical protein HMPREF2678_05740 [Corynebacterium sp. HMSC058E07]